MTAKEVKYMNILKRYFAVESSGDEAEYAAVMDAAIEFDYASAVRLWEYALTERESSMSDGATARVLADVTEAVFEKKNAVRLARTIAESPLVRGAIYRFSRTALSRSEPIGYLVADLVQGRVDEAEDIMKCALKNAGGDFGAFLLAAVERVIIELIKKNAKNPMPKKISSLILTYADKIKGAERALIHQRIRELG